jgi:hypothetical protein
MISISARTARSRFIQETMSSRPVLASVTRRDGDGAATKSAAFEHGHRSWNRVRSQTHWLSWRRQGGLRLTGRHRLIDRIRTLVRILPPQQTQVVRRKTQQARSSQRLQVWTCNLLLLMLYRVADQLREILFIADPFRRLLRICVRNARICSSSNSCQRAANHSNGHDDAARLDGIAFELA